METIKHLRPFSKFCVTIGEIPSSYTVSLTYEEQLLWLCNYIEKTVIPAVNNNAEAVIELQNLYKELKSYVDNYFTNLDVQEEINNKLDEMATDGTLDRIINQNIFGEINNKINNLENSQNPLGIYKGKNLVVFGDSFTDPDINNSVNGYWVNRVAQSTGMTAFNYAKGGASLLRENNSFRMQVNYAINNMTDTQKSNTSVIILYLADTDILEDTDMNDYVTEYETICHLLVQNFVNAKIIVAPFTWRCNKLFKEYNSKMNDYIFHMKRWSNFPVQFLDNARYWLLGERNYFQNQYHPNQNGYMVIANHFINAIYGGQDNTRNSYSVVLNLDNQTEDRNIEIEHYNGYIHINFYCTFDTELNNKHEWISNFPEICLPKGDIVAPLMTATGETVGTFVITNYEKKANLYINHLPANTAVFLAPLTYRASANFEY